VPLGSRHLLGCGPAALHQLSHNLMRFCADSRLVRQHRFGWRPVSATPTALCPIAQGCRTRLPWDGVPRERPYANGVASRPGQRFHRPDATPLG
jgi:hypothetical protein